MKADAKDSAASIKRQSLRAGLLLRALQLILLSFGLHSMMSCSPKASVVMVDKSQIEKLPDGSYKVSRGWMANRVKMEAALRAALRRCERSE